MASNEKEGRTLAETFRREHGLDDRPLDDLFDLIHATTGCDVLAVAADESEHGLTMRDPDRGVVVIAVAVSPHPLRQRSSLAHELGHVLFDDLLSPTPPGERSPQEIRADAFARHLLLPLSAAKALAVPDRGAHEQTISDLVHAFGLSPHAVAIQLKEVGLELTRFGGHPELGR